MTTHIRSKERVAKHGEVFTPEHIVHSMHNLIDNWGDPTMIYLEPTCGHGNFVEAAVQNKHGQVRVSPPPVASLILTNTGLSEVVGPPTNHSGAKSTHSHPKFGVGFCAHTISGSLPYIYLCNQQQGRIS